MGVEVSAVLEDLVKFVTLAARSLERALLVESIDAFRKYAEEARVRVEKLLKYIEDNPEKVSAAVSRPELKKAQKALEKALSIIGDSVGTLGYSHDREFLQRRIKDARDLLRMPRNR